VGRALAAACLPAAWFLLPSVWQRACMPSPVSRTATSASCPSLHGAQSLARGDTLTVGSAGQSVLVSNGLCWLFFWRRPLCRQCGLSVVTSHLSVSTVHIYMHISGYTLHTVPVLTPACDTPCTRPELLVWLGDSKLLTKDSAAWSYVIILM
jgi:hypothetical protein